MAEDESNLELLDLDLDDQVFLGISKDQALYRGWKVRKGLREIQQLYENIVQDIDGSTAVVSWTIDHSVAIPSITRGRSKVNKKAKGCIKDSSNAVKTSEKASTDASDVEHRSDEAPLTHVHQINEGENKQTGVYKSSQQSFGFLIEQDVDCDRDNSRQNKIGHNVHCKPVSYTDSRNEHDSSDHPKSISIAIQAEVTESHLGNNGSSHPHIIQPDSSGRVDNSCRSCSTNRQNPLPVQPAHYMKNEQKYCANAPFSSKEMPLVSDDFRDPEFTHASQARCVDGPMWRDEVAVRDEATGSEKIQNPARPAQSSSGHRDNRPLKTDQDASCDKLPDDRSQLEELRKTTTMELLWVQQAINSRKHYLRLKQQLS